MAALHPFLFWDDHRHLPLLQMMFGSNHTVAVQDPSYPVYVDTSVIMGMTGGYNEGRGNFDNIEYMSCQPGNDFFPDLSKVRTPQPAGRPWLLVPQPVPCCAGGQHGHHLLLLPQQPNWRSCHAAAAEGAGGLCQEERLPHCL